MENIVDILVSEEDKQVVREKILMFCDSRFSKEDGFSIEERVVDKKEKHYWIDVRLLGESVFLFDLIMNRAMLTSCFTKHALLDCLDIGVYQVPSLQYECMIRICELIEHPEKNWHLDFLREHADICQELDIIHCFENEYQDLANDIIKQVQTIEE